MTVSLILPLAMLAGVPAFAQIDLQGTWGPRYHEDQEDRIPGTYMGDYVGMPITDEGRLRGEAWDSSRLTMQEQQCRVHVSPYIYRGPLQLRIWEERDPESQRLIAIKQWIQNYQQLRTIWMDGRPHPSPNAAHTWMGFSTGKVEGNALVVTTTHIKTGWIRRNGLVQSDRATMTEYFIRHGDHLTHVRILYDVYVSEPLMHTTDFVLDPYYRGNWIYPCEYVEEIADRPKGQVPHFLPGQNPFLKETAEKLGLPPEVVRGGADTVYPEYRLKAKGAAVPARPASGTPKFDIVRIPGPGPNDVEVLPVQGDVYMIAGGGGNIAVQAGKQGVVLVDSKTPAISDKVLAALSKLTNAKTRYIINTSADPDHAGGNKSLREAGVTITGANVTRDIADAAAGAAIVSHENVMNRMVAAKVASPNWPTSTFNKGPKELFFNGEPIEVIHIPNAHTDGDSIVHFRRSDVIATGDIYVTDGYPVIDVAKGGNIQGIVDGINRVLDMIIPDYGTEGGTMVIPGHGRISDEADVVEYRDMVTIVRDRVQDMIKKGMTLDQAKAAKPTRDYDPVYGPGDAFVEAVYRSLSGGNR